MRSGFYLSVKRSPNEEGTLTVAGFRISERDLNVDRRFRTRKGFVERYALDPRAGMDETGAAQQPIRQKVCLPFPSTPTLTV